MEQLDSVFRAVCLGGCICGVGLLVVAAGFLTVTGRGILGLIKDTLGFGTDPVDMISETQEAIQENRQRLRAKRDQVISSDGIPDFDAAVAKYSQQGSPNLNDFSAQSAPPASPQSQPFPPAKSSPLRGNMRRLGSGKRFEEDDLQPPRRRDDDDTFEIYDNSDV